MKGQGLRRLLRPVISREGSSSTVGSEGPVPAPVPVPVVVRYCGSGIRGRRMIYSTSTGDGLGLLVPTGYGFSGANRVVMGALQLYFQGSNISGLFLRLLSAGQNHRTTDIPSPAPMFELLLFMTTHHQ